MVISDLYFRHLEKDGFDLAILHENILKMIKTKCFYLLTSKPSQDLVPLEGSPKKQTGPVAITNGAGMLLTTSLNEVPSLFSWLPAPWVRSAPSIPFRTT